MTCNKINSAVKTIKGESSALNIPSGGEKSYANSIAPKVKMLMQ